MQVESPTLFSATSSKWPQYVALRYLVPFSNFELLDVE